MAEKLKLELVTPYKRVLSEEVDDIQAPGTIGELGILPGHTPLLTTLKIGELTYRKGNETFHIAVNWGHMEVDNDRVSVLVETAEVADQIDLARAKEALSQAEAALKKLSNEEKEFVVMEAALERAKIRVQVASKKVR